MSLAKQIQQARKKADLSVEDAAARAEISESYWQKLEAGQMQNPSVRILEQIAASFGISVAELLDLDKTASAA